MLPVWRAGPLSATGGDSLSIITGAGKLNVNRGPQIDHTAALMHQRQIRWRHHHATSVASTMPILASQLINSLLLATAKTGLAFHIEDPRDIRPRLLFNNPVRIEERTFQYLGKVAPQGAFPSTHGTDQY